MEKLRSFILILGLVTFDAKSAEVCTNAPESDRATKKVNLTREMPPVRDQDSIGWCYGFTSADLLTHYLYTTKGKNVLNNTPWADYRQKSFSVSAMGVASMFNQANKNDYVRALNNKSLSELKKSNKKVVAEGGTLLGALMIAKDKGFCFERDVSSEDFSYVADHRCAVRNRCNISEILNIIYDSPKEKVGCNDLYTLQKVFPALKIENIKAILEKTAKQNALHNLVNAACQKRVTNNFITDHPRFKSKTIQFGQPSHELMEFLDDHLDRGIPVGIMYYADFLTGAMVSKSAHASSIVGKAFNPATCEMEYILRNSWGRGCGYYLKENPNYTKCTQALKTENSSITYFSKMTACKKEHKPLPRNPRVRCEDPSGYVYVRKSDLAKQIFNTTAIQEDSLF